MSRPLFRLARVEEADLLSELCFQSKAHWGYDVDFMEKCRESLRVDVGAIEGGLVLVGEQESRLTCVSIIERLEGDLWELDAFFVRPDFIGQGLGRKLFGATLELLTNQGCRELEILSDPQARPFYEALGATFVKHSPSNAIPDRSLPLLKFIVDNT